MAKRELLRNKWELIRYCSKQFQNIVGGFSKLLKYFIRNYNPRQIITYSDIRWNCINKNNVYNINGFEFVTTTRPNYWYLKKHKWLNRIHRFNFQKYKLINKGHDQSLTEHEIMKNMDYYRIYDCGHQKFEMNL